MNPNPPNLEFPEVFAIVRQLIAEETNHEADEIDPDSHLEDDLSIPLEANGNDLFTHITSKINQHFDIELEPDLFLAEEYENQTLELLVELITDEINLQ